MSDEENLDDTMVNEDQEDLRKQLKYIQVQMKQLQMEAAAAKAATESERLLRLQIQEQAAAAVAAAEASAATQQSLRMELEKQVAATKHTATECENVLTIQQPAAAVVVQSVETVAVESVQYMQHQGLAAGMSGPTISRTADSLQPAITLTPTTSSMSVRQIVNAATGTSADVMPNAYVSLPQCLPSVKRNQYEKGAVGASADAFGGTYSPSPRSAPILQPRGLTTGIIGPGITSYSPAVTSTQEVPNLGRHMTSEDNKARFFGDYSHDHNSLYRPVQPHNRKIYDLTDFDGSPEDWPMFSTAFVESTNVYQYTNFENCLRLQRCLKGEAKETVASLLIHPDNVWEVYAQLQNRFGRHDLLIRSQIQKVRAIPPFSENNIGQIVSFAIKVRNLATFLRSTQGQNHLANPTLLEELLNKMPMSQRIEWAQYSYKIQPYATVADLSEWLDQKSSYVSLVTVTSSQQICDRQQVTPNKKGQHRVQHVSEAKDQKLPCVLCDKSHQIEKCLDFLNRCVADRWGIAKRNRLCFCCLKTGHNTTACQNKVMCTYEDCDRFHNLLLHEVVQKNSVTDRPKPWSRPSSNVAESDPLPGKSESVNCSKESDINVVFRIVPVTVYGPQRRVTTYALLDDGSSISMIDEALAATLGLQGESTSLTLQWVKENTTTREPSMSVNVEISGRGKGMSKLQLRGARTVKNICLPQQTLRMSELHTRYHHLKYLPVREYVNAKPMLLIGLDNCHLGLAKKTYLSPDDGPVVVKTKLGWVVFGPTKADDAKVCGHIRAISMHVREPSGDDVEKLVSEYFTTENFGVKELLTPLESVADTRARQLVTTTTSRIGNRYQCGLLWKSNNVELPESFEMSRRRLLSIERKMKRDPDFAVAYNHLIAGYLEKGYARKLPENELHNTGSRIWYLPHFGVHNPNKTKKIRLVFDAAAESNGVSLNSQLLKGPDEQRPLTGVLFNFRMNNIAVCADIKEMFHQILIRPEDRCAQRFLWRRGDQSKPVEIFEMVAMTFGATCSPYIAQAIKNTNALTYSEKYPRAVKSILHHHYVDDFVDSFATEDEAIQVSTAVRNIHRTAGFELRSFVSNSKKVVTSLQGASSSTDTEVNLDKNIEIAAEKMLGMYWCTSEDVFTFKLNFHRVSPDVLLGRRRPSKRELLSIAMSIFDPFGLLANMMVYIKIVLREVWRYNIEWDEPIPDGLYSRWILWRDAVNSVATLRLQRCYFSHSPIEIQLHVFVDASEDAFSAVAYWRAILADGSIDFSFVAGKTRCAPIKLLSIPRLELQSAVLGTRLQRAVLKDHDMTISKKIFWSDSGTVISWIRSEHRRYKPFVAHRVSEILDTTKPSEWIWIPSELNVAEDATRGTLPPCFNPRSRWLYGPNFLRENESIWPEEMPVKPDEDCQEELRPRFLLLAQAVASDIIDISKFSDYLRLKRVVAFVRRFVNNFVAKHHLATKTISGEISAQELDAAELWICKTAQRDAFSQEVTTIQDGGSIPKGNHLHKLCPYLDKNAVLRVYGRIIDAATSVPFMTRRPIILPKDHSLTRLVVAYYHRRLHHQNEGTIINEIRVRFWVPHLRQLVRSIRLSCLVCKLRSAKPNTPMMGQLPIDRLTPYVRPFTYSGVDYFGPLHVAIGRRREKRWVAVFTCLTIRAIHLELAADLSTDSFILCLRNFVNRRGVPVRMRSDNGTNFVGADGELRSFRDVFDEAQVQREMSSSAIEWVFNCPANPSAGGAWERMVQSVKRVLNHTLQTEAPRVETLCSLLIEAENIINSRPLTHLPVTTDDEEPLTPNHFLLGTTNSTQTPGTSDVRIHCLRKQWRIAQQLKNRFWKRWMTEYLPTLTRRSKWCEKVRPLQIGDLVFICDPDMPRSKWCRGRITKVYMASDDQVRSAEIQTAKGILRRPASKLAPLDVCGEYVGHSRGPGCRGAELDTAFA